MAPKSKLILITAALLLRKKKICAVALLVMLNKVENEGTGRRFWVRKIFQERKAYGLHGSQNMCKAVALFYNIRIRNKRFITIHRTNENFLKHV